MGENAGRRTLVGVPDGERSATVIDEAGIVKTVSPGGVFERPITDGGPKSRHLGPRGFHAGGGLACYLAHGQSLSPVLDSQVTSGCGIESEGHVTGGEDTRSAAAHVRVDLDPPGLDGQAGPGGDASLGFHAPGHQEQVALSGGLAGEADRPASIASTCAPRRSDTPSSSSHAREPR